MEYDAGTIGTYPEAVEEQDRRYLLHRHNRRQKVLNCLQWMPVLGIPVALGVSFDKNYESVIDRFFYPSAIWHGVTSCISLIYTVGLFL